MIKLTTKIGKIQIETDLPTMKDVHRFMNIYGKVQTECDVCHSENVFPSFMSPGGNEYWMMECGNCGATANWGQKREGEALFWKDDKMTQYTGDTSNADAGNAPQQSPPQSDSELMTPPPVDPSDKLPF